MSNYTKKRIEEIKKLTTETIPVAINKGITFEEYYANYRIPLNLTVIQAIFGAEFNSVKNGDNFKAKFNHKLADVGELSEISHLLNDFISRYEKEFIIADDLEDEDDMEIPSTTTIVTSNGLPTMKKINKKNIQKYFFKDYSAVSKKFITGLDVYDLADQAKKIRKTKNRNIMLVIGGISLLVTGGAIATVCIINSKKDKKVSSDVPEVDLDDIDDTPSVEFIE